VVLDIAFDASSTAACGFRGRSAKLVQILAFAVAPTVVAWVVLAGR
jgi:hypothetical protein